jgi:uncharacterized protein (DUF2147 family)
MAHKIIITFISLLFSAGVFAQSADAIVGKFKNEDRGDFITIYKGTDGLYYGKNDKGELILYTLKYDTEDKTWNGLLIPPGKNITMDVSISVVSTDKLKMKVTKFFISSTNTLTRVK